MGDRIIIILDFIMAPVKYLYGLCGTNAEDVIECSTCNEWIHKQCIPLSYRTNR